MEDFFEENFLRSDRTTVVGLNYNLEGRGDVELCLVVRCSPSPPTALQGGEHSGEIAATWSAKV